MKLDVLFWVMIGLSQLAVWNLHFAQWEHGWGDHRTFWERRLPTGVPAEALKYLGALALVVALLQLTRKRLLIVAGLVLGLPFLWWVLYHCWVPYLFDCCSLWHHGGNYRNFDFTTMAWKSGVAYPEPKRMLKAWAKEYRESIRLVPLLHDSPFFVDNVNIILTVLVVLAYYYSLKALVWPHHECDGQGEEQQGEVVTTTTTTATDDSVAAKAVEEAEKKEKKKIKNRGKKEKKEGTPTPVSGPSHASPSPSKTKKKTN